MSGFLDKANKAYAKKNYAYAIEMWTSHLKLKPNDLEARQKLRQAMRENKPAGGGGWFSKVKGLVSKVSFHVNKSDPEQSMHKAEESLKDDPRNKDVLAKLGQASLLANHAEVAVWVYQDLTKLDKEDKEAWRGLARSLKAHGDLQSAIQAYEHVRRIDPSDGEAQSEVKSLAAAATSAGISGRKSYKDLIDKDQAKNLAKDLQRVRTPEQARERIVDLKEALESDPENTKHMMMIADMHMMCKEPSDAKQWLEKALATDPDLYEAEEKLGDIKLKQYEDAVNGLRAKARKDAGAKAKYEKLLKEKQAFEVQEYSKRFEAHPTELKHAFKLGQAQHDAGMFQEAVGTLQKAKSDARFKVDSGYYLGMCLYKMKNARMAIKELEAARADLIDMDDDNNKKITYLLGRIYESAKKPEKALAQYEKIAVSDYSYKDIQKRMEALGEI